MFLSARINHKETIVRKARVGQEAFKWFQVLILSLFAFKIPKAALTILTRVPAKSNKKTTARPSNTQRTQLLPKNSGDRVLRRS
tara:strand:- start:242 stop:493 length:252 start_codon:yes stop_codon:yes gene_type:complete